LTVVVDEPVLPLGPLEGVLGLLLGPLEGVLGLLPGGVLGLPLGGGRSATRVDRGGRTLDGGADGVSTVGPPPTGAGVELLLGLLEVQPRSTRGR
jgi:hypothetical protein